ncbi:retrotransposon protein, putative, ty1-copia subclass [Tanacetum coccineum]|uniref:Retrotransposon protein, putative, ty1-copia subclass n=1 Tax=Tanacetum coccineum TaxID=301880 RepID=A0ABQ5DS12_9ASTR
MKGYVEKLERLGYVLPQDISVGLILNGLTKDFVGFVRNYNMHNMGKTIGEIHAMLIEYEKGKNKVKGKGKDKKDYIPKPKNPKPTAMERPAKDDACHHCKEVGHWKRNCPVYLAELQKKRKQVGSASSSVSNNGVLYFNAVSRNGIYEIDMHDLVPNVNSIYNVWGCEALVKRDTPDKLEQRSVKCIFIGCPKETMGHYFYFLPENKIIVVMYAEFFEKRLISQEISGRVVDLEEIQKEEDTTPSEITRNIP